MPVDFRYDLDPNIAPSLKTVVIIYRCNGTWIEYWMGPSRTVSNSIYLAAGDIIWLIVPPTGATPTPTSHPSRPQLRPPEMPPLRIDRTAQRRFALIDYGIKTRKAGFAFRAGALLGALQFRGLRFSFPLMKPVFLPVVSNAGEE